MSRVRILQGDTRAVMASLPAGSAQCCVTSPPYYGLRDYGVAGQIGLEPTPDEYVAEMVSVFREVRRVLADDGTLWLNIGDSYAMSTKGAGGSGKQHTNNGSVMRDRSWHIPQGLKPKDLLMIPARVAIALQADGWYLRSEIVWHKPNPMPESVTDRPTNAHEKVYLLTKRERYFYDADAIKEQATWPIGQKERTRGKTGYAAAQGAGRGNAQRDSNGGVGGDGVSRNARNVWTIAPKPFKGAHFATMPIDLAERCILAGSRFGDTVLDPFGGAATTGVAATKNGRRAVLAELNPEYIAIARARVDEAEAAELASLESML